MNINPEKFDLGISIAGLLFLLLLIVFLSFRLLGRIAKYITVAAKKKQKSDITKKAETLYFENLEKILFCIIYETFVIHILSDYLPQYGNFIAAAIILLSANAIFDFLSYARSNRKSGKKVTFENFILLIVVLGINMIPISIINL